MRWSLFLLAPLVACQQPVPDYAAVFDGSAGRWVDLSVMIFPPVTGDIPLFGIPEVATIVCLGCLSGLLFVRSFARARAVPRNDPYLTESLQYRA